jgi:DNA-binding response OmpR family regulator
MSANAHILVVDDEPDFLDTTVELLTMEGFRAIGARSGSEAMRLLRQPGFDRVDVFLIDFRMPDMNGGETLQKIRASGNSGSAILVSAAADVVRLASDFGFDGHLQKPCDLDELLRAIRHHCAQVRPHAPAQSAP